MGKLLCGFAQADITPQPETTYLDGYGGRVTPASGVKDPLYAKVCVLQSDENVLAVIALDVCGLNHTLKERLRGWIRSLTGLKDAQFALCATHTHSGPACGVLDGLPINWLYWNHVGDCIVQAIGKARSSACEGRFRFTFGHELTQSANRRGRDVIDRRVPVCAFFDTQERLRGVIASASCHAVCNTDMEISADYPSVLTREAAERYPGVPFLFLQGRGGDVNPYSDEYAGTMLPLEILGRELADCVFAAMDSMEGGTEELSGIRSVYRTVPVPMWYPAREDLEECLANIRQRLLTAAPEADRRLLHVELAWHIQALSEIEKTEEPFVNADFQIVVIGNAWVLAFVPFELLTPTGNAIEEMIARYGIPSEKCFVIGYSNGTNGYLAVSSESKSEGYETCGAAHWYGIPICCAESEQTVLQTFSNMAEELLGDPQ